MHIDSSHELTSITLVETQECLDDVLNDCHDGVGCVEADVVRGVGVGGVVRGVGVGGFRYKNPGGASGGRGGKGEESNDQHGGKVWRFGAVGRNGGIGVDSSDEVLGVEDIDRSGIGDIDGLEDQILLGDSVRVVGTQDCRVVVVEDYRTGGELKSCRIFGEPHMLFFVEDDS